MPKSAEQRRKALRTRVIVYGSLVAGLWGFYVWQPWEYDFIPRKLPVPNPPVDPDSAFLFSGKAKVLVVTAHPDDSAFYIGGLLTRLGAKGTEIHQIICTDGDKAYYGPFSDSAQNIRVRREEAILEGQTWHGRSITFLGHPDGRLRNDAELVEQISDQIRRVKPDYVLCFDGNYPPRFSHQDHRRSGDSALIACRQTAIPRWVLQYSTIAANYFMDITEQWPAQQELLKIHKSQFFGKHLDGIVNMVGGNAEADGDKGGYAFAEGLRCTRL